MRSARRRPGSARVPALLLYVLRPAAETSTRRSTRCGKPIASSAATKPPIELPTTAAAVDVERVEQGVEVAGVAGDRDRLGRHRRVAEAGKIDGDDAVASRANTGSCSSQLGQEPDEAVDEEQRRPLAQLHEVDRRIVYNCPVLMLAPVDVQPGRASRRPVGVVLGVELRR